jgi:hypothetical protein
LAEQQGTRLLRIHHRSGSQLYWEGTTNWAGEIQAQLLIDQTDGTSWLIRSS